MRRRLFAVALALLSSGLLSSGRAHARPQAAGPTLFSAVEGEAPTLLVLELEPIGVSEGQARLIDQLVTETYSRREGLKVIASADIQKLIELEAARSSAGCDDMTCLSEIAGALGARYVVFGSVGRLGDLFVVNLNVFDAERAEAVQRHTIRTQELERLPEELELVVLGIERPAPGEPAPAPPEGPSFLLVAGGGAAATGALCLAGAGLGALVVDGTLGDPSARPRDKGLALSLAPFVAGAAVGGAVLLAAGAAAVGVEVVE